MGLFDHLFKKNTHQGKETGKTQTSQNRALSNAKTGVTPRPPPLQTTSVDSYVSNGKQTAYKKAPLSTSPKTKPKRLGGKSPGRNRIVLARELVSPHLVPSSPVSSAYVKTFDCIAFVVHCPVHAKIAVPKSRAVTFRGQGGQV